MRFTKASLTAVLFLLAAWPATAHAAPPSSPVEPSCATGPTTVRGTTWGTPCDDVIRAAPGVATVRGGAGDDTIVAAPIVSTASCPEGCRLGIGSQTFEGGPGDDVVYGERGNDRLDGGEGNDLLFGGIGDDLLGGGPGADRLSGGFGADSVDGEAGDDYVRGDGTIDTILDSGGGVDTLSYSTGITPGFPNNPSAGYPDFSSHPGFPPLGGERGIYLDLGANLGDNGVAPFGGGVDEVEGLSFERVIGTPFADYIIGSTNSETIYGSGGGDVILGEGGGDALYGGPDGDHLDGGSGTNAIDGGPGSDNCVNGTESACEPGATDGGVAMRDPTKVAAGFAASGQATAQLYLTGSNAAESITATYAPGPPASVTFDLSSGSPFDQSPAAAGGCGVASATELVCTLSAPLDSILLAGMGGSDQLETSGFPRTVSVVITGGEGGDSLTGGEETEDVLVDGDSSGSSNDTLSALDGDDALLHNAGPDIRLGGNGNDLFLSNSICDGDLLSGGAGRDNSSWAKFQESGVEANLGLGQAGRPGAGLSPNCGGEPVDGLQLIEDLEGTKLGDFFYGGTGENQLLGWAGPDTYFSDAGDDTILANSGDADLVIDCGPGDADRALIDRPQYGDPVPSGCESVQEADVNSFRFQTPVLPPPPTATGTGSASPRAKPRTDRKPPQTKILGPHRRILTTSRRKRRVVLRFSASEQATFRCRLDRRRATRCVSPRTFWVGLGRHTLRVIAIDLAGNPDPTPALFKFRVSA